MNWYGWCHGPDGWERVCEHASRLECARLLARLRPDVPGNLWYGLTRGGVPRWTPSR